MVLISHFFYTTSALPELICATPLGLLAVGFNEFGSEEELVKNPIRHLYDVYVNINKKADSNEEVGKEIHNAARAYFKKMEDGVPFFFLDPEL